jgi:serine/threonine protein kinase
MPEESTQTIRPGALPLGHMDALPPGTVLGEFELQGLLGVGGFGMVYRGYDHSLHRAVAIKEYMPSSLVGRGSDLAVTAKSVADAQPFQAGLQSFIAEARLLARFDHPSLVKVYRFWEANNTAYMAMPLYEGITLKEARRRMSGPPPEGWLHTVLWSVLAALKVLHDNSTLHRDVSPDNIFLQNVGPPVLLDLGASRRAILDTSHKHTAVLKVNYAPIEQYADAKDMQEGPWTDLYAVAAVMHGCLCNEPPLPATFRVVRDRMPSFAQVAQTARTHFGQSYSSAFIRAIEHGLAIEPNERPQSVDTFVKEMGLKTPRDIARFDWKAALGGAVTLEVVDTDKLPVTTAVLTTQPASDFQDTVLQPTTIDTETAKAVRTSSSRSARPGKRPVAAVAKPPRYGLWIAATLVAVAIGGGILSMGSHRAQLVPPSPPVSAETAVLPVTVVVPEAPATSASEEVALVAPVSKPVVIAPRAAPKPTSVNTVLAPITEKSASSKPAKPEVAHNTVTPAVVLPPPVTLCPDATVLTRTMCIYRECQKPEHAQLPICIADKKHWEEQNKSRISP